MSRELPCPRCGQYDGEQLFNCEDCEREFCDGEGCADGASWFSARCPDCDKSCDKIANLVEPEEADQDQGEEESEENRNNDDE